jgi:feruloyl esterase
MKNLLAIGMWGLTVILPSVPSEAASCDSVRTVRLANTAITLAQDVGAGEFVPPGTKPGEPVPLVYAILPAFCRVSGVIRPSRESNIKFEVWLPISGWNGKCTVAGGCCAKYARNRSRESRFSVSIRPVRCETAT